MRNRATKAAVALSAAGLALVSLTGCGSLSSNGGTSHGSSSSPSASSSASKPSGNAVSPGLATTDQRAAVSIADSMKHAGLGITDSQAHCLGAGWVSKIGVKGLVKDKVLDPKDPSKALDDVSHPKMGSSDAHTAASVMVHCWPQMGKAMVAGTHMPAKAEKCLTGKMTDTFLVNYWSLVLTNDETKAHATSQAAMHSCEA